MLAWNNDTWGKSSTTRSGLRDVTTGIIAGTKVATELGWRPVEAVAEGDKVTLLQALGGSATVTTSEGEMARLSPADSIDFGFIEAPVKREVSSDEPFNVDLVWEAAATVYDPEIPVDIVELGLVYKVDPIQLTTGGWQVEIDMSVTAPFCGMGDILRQDLHDAVAVLPGVEFVDVRLVFDPPWDVSRLSDVARLELGMM